MKFVIKFFVLLAINWVCISDNPTNVQPAPAVSIKNKTDTYINVKSTTADLVADQNFEFALSVLGISATVSQQVQVCNAVSFLSIGMKDVIQPDYCKTVTDEYKLDQNKCLLFTDIRFILLPKVVKDYIVSHCGNFYNWVGLNQHFHNHILSYMYINNAEFQSKLDAAYDAYVQAVYNDLQDGGGQLAQDIEALYSTYYNRSLFGYYNIYCTRTAEGATTKPVATLVDEIDIDFLDHLSPSFETYWTTIKEIMKDVISKDPKLQFGKSFYDNSIIYKFGAQSSPGVQFFKFDDVVESASFNPLNTQDNLLNIQNYCLPYALDLSGSWDFGTAVIKYCFSGNQQASC